MELLQRTMSRLISIHALREEGDPTTGTMPRLDTKFLSTPSARRATIQQTPPARIPAISIHALREEGDERASRPRCGCPRFLSTPSARRATSRSSFRSRPAAYFYPRPPRGGRPAATWHRRPPSNFYPRPPRGGRRGREVEHTLRRVISIHALREEGDISLMAASMKASKFLSTPSARRATMLSKELFTAINHFYPRPPRGGRQQKQRQNLYFQTNYTTFCTNLEEP